jgi:hypothetical protein
MEKISAHCHIKNKGQSQEANKQKKAALKQPLK